MRAAATLSSWAFSGMAYSLSTIEKLPKLAVWFIRNAAPPDSVSPRSPTRVS